MRFCAYLTMLMDNITNANYTKRSIFMPCRYKNSHKTNVQHKIIHTMSTTTWPYSLDACYVMLVNKSQV